MGKGPPESVFLENKQLQVGMSVQFSATMEAHLINSTWAGFLHPSKIRSPGKYQLLEIKQDKNPEGSHDELTFAVQTPPTLLDDAHDIQKDDLLWMIVEEQQPH